jgi:hypothetical protein
MEIGMLPEITKLKEQFQVLTDLREGLCSETAQEALCTAKESEEEDKSKLRSNSRANNKK